MRKPPARSMSADLRLPVLPLLPLAALALSCSASQPPPSEVPHPSEPTAAAYGKPATHPQMPFPTATVAVPGQAHTAGAPRWPNFLEEPAADLPGALAQLDSYELALGSALAPVGGDVHVAQSRQGSPPAPLSAADACSIACAALASMQRSADHVCGLAGEKEAVCGSARDRVQRASARVAAACPACSVPAKK